MTTLVIMTSDEFDFGHLSVSYKVAHFSNILCYVFVILSIHQIKYQIFAYRGLCHTKR